MHTVVMITGIPGVGKTTVMDGFLETLKNHGVDEVGINEYEQIEAWKDLPESQGLVHFPEVGGFDILLEGYWPMSEFVGRRLALEIERRFDSGKPLVVFETARGVGEPLVTYSDFVGMIASHMETNSVRLANIEVIAPVADIEERMIARFLEDQEHAPPPGIEKKYLTEDGRPLCLSTEDLGQAKLEFLLVFNERVSNGGGKEAFRTKIESSLFPPLVEQLGLRAVSPEGLYRSSRSGLERDRNLSNA